MPPNLSAGRQDPRRTKCAAGVSCMSEDVLKSNFRAGPDENNDYRSMCDSLIGNGSAKWHAQQ